MATHEYVASFVQPPHVIFGLLADAERHNRILPFCKGVEVMRRSTSLDGVTEIDMQHLMVIPRVSIESNVRSGIRYQSRDRVFAMASALGDSNDALQVVAQVDQNGSGSQMRLSLDISALPLRYRLLLIEPVLRRAHTKLIEKMTRRADEVAAAARSRT